MPKAICYRIDIGVKQVSRILFHAKDAIDVDYLANENGLESSINGEITYSYRIPALENGKEMIFGRRPIGPRRADRKRRKF